MPEPTDPDATAARSPSTRTPGAANRDETAAGRAAAGAPSPPGFDPPAAPGEVGALGPYRIVKELGRGGMGAVYAAIDTRLERPLALKVMLAGSADAGAKERFLREARAAARVKHDHVVTVYEADERHGVPYIAMEFLAGLPLDAYLKREGVPPLAQVVRIASETAAGLSAAHELGLVHRDVKPANLWLEAPNGRVKVLDFGLARPVSAEAELTHSGEVVGTPAYMSPEQARGERVDHRTDLFSLGGVLYRLCTGRVPFGGTTALAALLALGVDEPTPVRDLNPAVPESLAALVHQLLAKAPERRPQSADEVVQRLRAIAQELAFPPMTASSSLPRVVQPTPSTAPEPDPFADLDSPDTDQTEADATDPPQPVRARSEGWRGWSWKVVLGFGSLFITLAGLVAGGILRSTAGDGVIVLEGLPPDATVEIDGELVPVIRSGDEAKVTGVREGPHRVRFVRGGVELLSSDVAVTLGGQPARVRLVPAPAAPGRNESGGGKVGPQTGADKPSLTFTVAADGTGQYATLADAVSLAPAGSKLLVKPGVYRGPVAVNKSLEIVGGAGVEVESLGTTVIAVHADGVRLSGLMIRGRRMVGDKPTVKEPAIDITRGKELVIEDCEITAATREGVSVQGAATGVRMTKCVVRDSEAVGLLLGGGCKVTLDGCTFEQNLRDGIGVHGSTLILRNCKMQSNGHAGMIAQVNSSVTASDCVFEANKSTGIIICNNAFGELMQSDC